MPGLLQAPSPHLLCQLPSQSPALGSRVVLGLPGAALAQGDPPPVPSLAVSLNGPHPGLAPYRPPTQLIAPPLLLSVVLNLLFSLAVQLCGFLLVQQQLWYSPSDIHR